MLCEIVQSWGHVTRAAYEGTAALREAESFLPDIALLDVGLPDISGYALAARLRQSSSARAVLIAVTGYGAASDRAKASEAGFDHHLVKPPNLEHIRFLLGAS
jgi:CheY-like chemotaxis protein